jgi:hypothetical protein
MKSYSTSISATFLCFAVLAVTYFFPSPLTTVLLNVTMTSVLLLVLFGMLAILFAARILRKHVPKSDLLPTAQKRTKRKLIMSRILNVIPEVLLAYGLFKLGYMYAFSVHLITLLLTWVLWKHMLGTLASMTELQASVNASKPPA